MLHAYSDYAGATLVASYTGGAGGGGLQSRTMTYTSFNKLASITQGSTSVSFGYDANFNRIVKTGPGGTTVYVGKLYEKTTNGSTTTERAYVYAGGGLVAVQTRQNAGAGTWRYVHIDHLGLNRPGNRGGCLVYVMLLRQPDRRVAGSSLPQLLPEGYSPAVPSVDDR